MAKGSGKTGGKGIVLRELVVPLGEGERDRRRRELPEALRELAAFREEKARVIAEFRMRERAMADAIRKLGESILTGTDRRTVRCELCRVAGEVRLRNLETGEVLDDRPTVDERQGTLFAEAEIEQAAAMPAPAPVPPPAEQTPIGARKVKPPEAGEFRPLKDAAFAFLSRVASALASGKKGVSGWDDSVELVALLGALGGAGTDAAWMFNGYVTDWQAAQRKPGPVLRAGDRLPVEGWVSSWARKAADDLLTDISAREAFCEGSCQAYLAEQGITWTPVQQDKPKRARKRPAKATEQSAEH